MISNGYIMKEVHKTTERYFLISNDTSYKLSSRQFGKLMYDNRITLHKQELICNGCNPVTTYIYKRSV